MLKMFRRLLSLFRRSKTDAAASLPLPSVAPSAADSPPTTDPKPKKTVSEPVPNIPNPREDSSFDLTVPARKPLNPGPPPQNPQIANLKRVLNVLRAYGVNFGWPQEALELRAIIGAIVANLPTVEVPNRDLERFIDQAIAASKSLDMESGLIDVTAQLLAEQVFVWLREQQTTVSNVVSAYLQQFAPDDETWDLSKILGLVQTVVAVLNDGSLSRSGGRMLVQKVVEAFDLDQALNRWVAPEWVALAQQVASYVNQNEVQMQVRSIAWAYIQQFQAILSPQLIDQILNDGPLNLSPAAVLSGNFTDFSQMLFYKFQLLEADPVVTKSHEAIALNVRKAILEFQARQESPIDVTQGVPTGDLEVSSPLR